MMVIWCEFNAKQWDTVEMRSAPRIWLARFKLYFNVYYKWYRLNKYDRCVIYQGRCWMKRLHTTQSNCEHEYTQEDKTLLDFRHRLSGFGNVIFILLHNKNIVGQSRWFYAINMIIVLLQIISLKCILILFYRNNSSSICWANLLKEF